MLNVELNNITLIKNDEIKNILEKIHFQVEKASVVSLIGKNGSGKTTILKAILSLLDERFYQINGKILFDNKDLLKLNIQELSLLRNNKIKFVPQDALPSFDPLRKISYYFTLLNLNEERLKPFLEKTNLPSYKEIKQLYPHQLSSGMAQRLSFIISIALNPLMLLLDEPTSALDPPIAQSVMEVIKEFSSKGNSVLLVTQDINFAAGVSNKIYILENNVLSETYTKDEIISGSIESSSLLNAYKELRNA